MVNLDLSSINEEARKIMLTFLGHQARSMQRMTGGVMNYSYKVHSFDETFVLRIYPDQNKNTINYEPFMIESCKKEGAYLPELCYDSRLNRIAVFKYNYIIYKYIEGEELRNTWLYAGSDLKKRLIDKIVFNLVKIAEIRTYGFGKIIKDNHAEFQSWDQFLEKSIASGSSHLNRLPNVNQIKLLNYLRKQKKDIHGVEKRLVWADLSLDNVIYNSIEDQVHFIDFESLISGDIHLCFGYLFAKEGESDFYLSLIERAKQVFNLSVDRIKFYTLIKMMRILPRLDKDLPTGIPRDPMFKIFPGIKSLVINDFTL